MKIGDCEAPQLSPLSTRWGEAGRGASIDRAVRCNDRIATEHENEDEHEDKNEKDRTIA
jgi:hypothetical protein